MVRNEKKIVEAQPGRVELKFSNINPIYEGSLNIKSGTSYVLTRHASRHCYGAIKSTHPLLSPKVSEAFRYRVGRTLKMVLYPDPAGLTVAKFWILVVFNIEPNEEGALIAKILGLVKIQAAADGPDPSVNDYVMSGPRGGDSLFGPPSIVIPSVPPPAVPLPIVLPPPSVTIKKMGL